jgi:hypothetical protein
MSSSSSSVSQLDVNSTSVDIYKATSSFDQLSTLQYRLPRAKKLLDCCYQFKSVRKLPTHEVAFQVHKFETIGLAEGTFQRKRRVCSYRRRPGVAVVAPPVAPVAPVLPPLPPPAAAQPPPPVAAQRVSVELGSFISRVQRLEAEQARMRQREDAMKLRETEMKEREVKVNAIKRQMQQLAAQLQ